MTALFQFIHRASAIRCSRQSSSVSSLQTAFRDPSSPFYLTPGTQGPSSPDPDDSLGDNDQHGSAAAISPQEEARMKLTEMGFDPLSFYEQKIVWGHQDSFRHVNNVHYVRFLESGRMFWITSLALELAGPQKVQDMLSGKGISLILKDIQVSFRRPVVYPDTLLVAHRPHNSQPTQFSGAAAIWSYAQSKVVATSESTLVWYDYDKLKKCDPGDEMRSILEKRIRTQ